MLMLIFFVLPGVIYLSLCMLPPGRPAAIGIGAAALVATALWITGDPAGEVDMSRTLAMIAGAGIALAAIVQAMRRALGPDTLGSLYPALVVGALLAAISLFLLLLGV